MEEAEEEGEHFPQLRHTADSTLNSKLTRQYKAEFDRYIGDEGKQRLAA